MQNASSQLSLIENWLVVVAHFTIIRNDYQLISVLITIFNVHSLHLFHPQWPVVAIIQNYLQIIFTVITFPLVCKIGTQPRNLLVRARFSTWTLGRTRVFPELLLFVHNVDVFLDHSLSSTTMSRSSSSSKKLNPPEEPVSRISTVVASNLTPPSPGSLEALELEPIFKLNPPCSDRRSGLGRARILQIGSSMESLLIIAVDRRIDRAALGGRLVDGSVGVSRMRRRQRPKDVCIKISEVIVVLHMRVGMPDKSPATTIARPSATNSSAPTIFAAHESSPGPQHNP
ncbi:MLO-like protein [Striga asiatica]|uniref:MLO-like protein n=1 Tax=Striga asiatica TaxID=4170 RepID=A0A5A7PSW1_STRAF|nr:MLO-like protein [Striga asiatica]